MSGSFFNELFDAFGGTFGIIIALVAIAVGLLSLFFGRRFYWVFVGLIGFFLGLTFGPMLFDNLNPTWQLLLTLIVAGAFAVLAIVMNKLMVALAGAISLGWLVHLITANSLPNWAVVLLTIIGAIVGLSVAWFFFDWGLMIFSSLSGASLTTRGLLTLIPGIAQGSAVIFLVLLVAGLIVQISTWSRGRTSTKNPA